MTGKLPGRKGPGVAGQQRLNVSQLCPGAKKVNGLEIAWPAGQRFFFPCVQHLESCVLCHSVPEGAGPYPGKDIREGEGFRTQVLCRAAQGVVVVETGSKGG